ncbi:MAG: antibiotic biosynthesis monooxygenase [Sulfitobacter sp.]|nr:antibiotic biosynthesis monooxygenase [Sulfitobacter sp.]
MQIEGTSEGPILRLFEVRTKPGCAAELLDKFATTSADVVQNEPGNQGYFFGRGAVTDEDYVIFASIWADLQAVKDRFGKDWQSSFLPPGYDALIEDCSIRHIHLTSGLKIG